MAKTKLSKQVEICSSYAIIVSPLCSKYNANSIKPFQEGAQVYNENYRSSAEFANVLRLHKNFLKGSISICNGLFDNYEPSKQGSVYTWSKHLFNFINVSKQILDEVYNMAYTVGRDDDTTKNIIDKEINPLVKIKRKVILEDGEYDIYKKTIFDWKCSIQAIYVEEQYMKHIVQMCISRQPIVNPNETVVNGGNTCAFRRTTTINDRPNESTPRL